MWWTLGCANMYSLQCFVRDFPSSQASEGGLWNTTRTRLRNSARSVSFSCCPGPQQKTQETISLFIGQIVVPIGGHKNDHNISMPSNVSQKPTWWRAKSLCVRRGMLAGSCQGAPWHRLQLSVKAKGCTLDRRGPSTTPKSLSFKLLHYP